MSNSALGACFGCCINPQWMIPPYQDFYKLPEIKFDIWGAIKLTTEEEAILKKLAEAWNLFTSLDKRSEADNQEYTYAIHKAQQLIALRVARRVNPEVWNQPC